MNHKDDTNKGRGNSTLDDILSNRLGKGDGPMAEVLIAYTKEIEKSKGQQIHETVKQIMDTHKEVIKDRKSDRECEVEDRKNVMDHQVKIMEIQSKGGESLLLLKERLMMDPIKKAEFLKEYEEERFEYYLNKLKGGLFGIEFKHVKATAALLAKQDVEQLKSALEADEIKRLTFILPPGGGQGSQSPILSLPQLDLGNHKEVKENGLEQIGTILLRFLGKVLKENEKAEQPQ